MKKMLLMIAMLVPFGMAQAQSTWTEVTAPVHLEYPGSCFFTAPNIAHGVVVDHEGKIWYNGYGAENGLFILNPDGTQASFSPIMTVMADQEIPTTNGRGMTIDADGNVLAVVSNQYLIRLDAATGAVKDWWKGPGSQTQPGIDKDGYVYIATVAGSEPIRILESPAYTEVGTVDDGTDYTWWSRATAVSNDGLKIIAGRLGGGLIIFESEDAITYTMTDSLIRPTGAPFFGGDVSSLQWGPDYVSSMTATGPFTSENGVLWMTDEGAFAGDKDLSTRNIKVFDLNAKTYYTLRHDSLSINPRGIGFAPDGTSIYVSNFKTGCLQKFNIAAGVPVEEAFEMPQAFELDRNYPNPFSASTTIGFKLRDPNVVTLRVYDATGRLVETLMEGAMQASGPHSVAWNAAAAPSGLYFYSLEVGGRRQVQAMVLAR